MSRLAYSADEAAAECGVSPATIKKAIRAGSLKAKRSARNENTGEPAGKYLIFPTDLQAWLEGLDAA